MKPSLVNRMLPGVHGTLMVAVCAACLSVAGCQMFDVETLRNPFAALSDQTPATSRLTDAIADTLDADAWTANHEWSPVTEPGSPLHGLRAARALPRWLFRPVVATGKPLFMVEDVIAAYYTDSNHDSVAASTDSRSAIEREAITQLSIIAHRDDLVGWNAAILLAHRDARSARPFVTVLAQLVGDPPMIGDDPNEENKKSTIVIGKAPRPISPDMRAAAAEAWCLVLATAETDGETAMALPGHLLDDMQRGREARKILKDDLPMSVEGELIRGIGRRVAPVRIRELAALLNRPPRTGPQASGGDLRRQELHRAAIDACVHYAMTQQAASEVPVNLHDDTVWPRTLWNCDDDNDPWVRNGFGLLLAITKDSRALEVLSKQIADSNSDVQHRALQNLGVLQNEEARSELQEYMTRESLLRKTAIQGLAAFGDTELVGYVGDEDARVREELARQLAMFPSAASAAAMADLLTDDVFSVQSAAVEGVKNWPDELLLPLLLHAGVDGNYQTRDNSLAAFARRTGVVVPPFRPDDEYSLRRDRATQIAATAGIAYPPLHEASQARVESLTRVDTERVEEIAQRLKTAVSLGGAAAGGFEIEWFRRLKPEDMSSVEKVYHRSEPAARSFLLREILPHLAPEYDALLRMDDADVKRRRDAAADLRKIGNTRTLPDIVLEQLSELLVREEDTVVWRDVIAAVEQDTSEPVTRIVQLAVNHRWPDVRQHGCDYVLKHGRPDFAVWMQALFQDSNPMVQLTAIRAAGQCRNQRVLEDQVDDKGNVTLIGLRRLMTSFTGEKHMAVVGSMARLLDPGGLDELNRISYSGDWRTRVAAIDVMAATGQTRFVDRLIDVLWLDREARPEVHQAALRAIEALIPVEEHPAELNRLATPQQQAATWHGWWEQRRRKFPTNSPQSAGNGYNRPQPAGQAAMAGAISR